MRIGVIRGDLPGPVYLNDLETISQYDPMYEPEGQTYYVGRPTTGEIETALAHSTKGAGACQEGSDISGSYPLTIDGTNDHLLLKLTPTASFMTFTIPHAVYANETDLLSALNSVLVGVEARSSETTPGGIVLESKTYGVDSYLEIDVNANSTANMALGLTAGVRDMPAAADYITACLPVGGPLDVSATTLKGVGAGTNANALASIPASRGTVTEVADAIAPYVVTTPTARLSFQVGSLSEFLSASYNPDPNRLPNGPAIAVVADDGVTPYAAGLPVLTSAVIGGGNLTLSGSGLGSYEIKETHVRITGTIDRRLSQELIEHEGGSVTDTAVVIPLTLVPGVAPSTCTAQLRRGTLASNAVVVS